MAMQKNDRLAPPLMYAFRAAHEKRDAKQRLDLRDEAGERVIAARRVTTRSPISESGLRREVMTDLLGLLNTTNLDAATDLSTLPAVRSSILNFGFPDLSWRTIDENGLSDVAREIEVALTDFEPRLARRLDQGVARCERRGRGAQTALSRQGRSARAAGQRARRIRRRGRTRFRQDQNRSVVTR